MRDLLKFLFCCLTVLAAPCTLAELVSAGDARQEGPPYKEGQVWSYKTRAGEEESTVLINKIEEYSKLGAIYHISVFDVKVVNPHHASGLATELPHFPVSQQTLDDSVVALLRVSENNPDYLEGYGVWKEAFDEGKAGVFTISLAEIVGVVEQSINQKH